MPLLTEDLRILLLRDLGTLRLELEAYAEEETIWAVPAGAPNSAGTLALHLAGNLQHYVGALLGGSGYIRDREREFAARDVPRSELLREIEAAERAVDATLPAVTEEQLLQPYPETFRGEQVPTLRFLLHLATHLAYHLGQINYHRRLVTGDSRGVGGVVAPRPTAK